MVEANESPLDGLRRELAEELGLHVEAFKLLALDWVSPHTPWDDTLVLVFDGGVLGPADSERLSIRDEELAEFRFVESGGLAELVRPRLWRRLQPALNALQSGDVLYLHDGEAPA